MKGPEAKALRVTSQLSPNEPSPARFSSAWGAAQPTACAVPQFPPGTESGS